MSEEKAFSASAIWKNLFSVDKVKKGSTEELLSKVPAFIDLTAKELKEVAAIVHRREYRTNEPVFSQGDPGLGMYIIQSGEVAITITGRDGNERELVALNDGDFFGELALLDESPRSANARCKTECLLIGFFRPDLFELIEKKASLGIKIVLKLSEIVAQRLRETDKELSKMKNQLELVKERGMNNENTASESSKQRGKESAGQ
ncbi:MAG: cyclic nucleotide-binding domain-containing protein [Bacteroidota bacterium]